MMLDAFPSSAASPAPLQAYLLGQVDFDAVLRLQRRLHFDVTGDRSQAAVVVCEHARLITVGRHGSRSHMQVEPEELQRLEWRIRWINRGGGCWLQQPGQLAVYLLLPLDRLGLELPELVHRLGTCLVDLVHEWGVRGEVRHADGGIWVRNRLIAGLGLAVRDWVTCFGFCLNVHPDLDAYRKVRCYPQVDQPMTSVERERRGRISPSLIRQRLLEALAERFAAGGLALFTDHPLVHDARESAATARAALA